MDPKEYVRALRQRWYWVVGCACAGLLAAVASTLLATPQYASTARLFVTTSQSDSSTADNYQGSLFSAQRVTSYADLAKSRDLATSVIASLDLHESPSELSDQVTATVVPDTVNLEITVLDPDAAQAQAKAQGYAEGMVDLVRELETPGVGQQAPIKATIVDAASAPTDPVSPKPVRNLALGFVLGLLIGIGVALLREITDNTIKSAEDMASQTDAPVLAAIAFDATMKAQPLVTSLESHAPRVEAFRVLRTNLQFVDVDNPDKVIVVTSAVPEEGKTSTSVNLAIAMAQAGRKTLLIEGDLRRPKAAAALNLDNSVGVTTLLLGKVALEDALQTHPESSLDVLASGVIPPNPAELLQSRAMADLLLRLRERYDMIIVDAPPLLPVTDGALLANQADGALIVVRFGHTSRDQLAGAVNRLRQVDVAPVGLVLNMVRRTNAGHGYGYGYGYAPTPATEV